MRLYVPSPIRHQRTDDENALRVACGGRPEPTLGGGHSWPLPDGVTTLADAEAAVVAAGVPLTRHGPRTGWALIAD